ncbi:MOSC domain-containing protein [Oceanomicrobium pacificus]|uniref:MOSC domain-containing protein n=1 Tax=Oceanomicrobium pacificus TaxID=2692916 RepID=A0A6B0U2V7_9RHOB|nr:MOSC domain-containing protein [Oceanomicrobium pacificus]MXU65321.1 MOSC domain-containing protein [Oceanomicrobium pacificus]
MPIVSPTDITGTVDWLGLVADREVTLCADPVTEVEVTYAGFTGEYHGGLTRGSCSRVLAQYPERGTEIRNTRQITILSAEELADIAAAMELESVNPEWVGANLVLRGIPDLTQMPPASRLVFEGGVTITVDVENGPCQFPAQVIEKIHPGHGKRFKSAAEGRRGVTAWVEREGRITLGETVRLHVPPQRIYRHAAQG